jgi:DNA-binding XRE family transcriptional regulator
MSHTTSEKDLTSKKDLAPERRAALDAVHELARQKLGPDDLIDRGEIDEPVPHGQFVELLAVMAQLKRERERKGLSLTDLSEVSGLTRAAISRLENGWNSNPTLDTLFRYALALNMDLKLTAQEAAD